MNNPKDFRKRDDGVIVNKNTKDYQKARRRNALFGNEGKMQKTFIEVEDMKIRIQQTRDAEISIKQELLEIKSLLVDILSQNNNGV
ncbi:MAG: hypothetical protein DRQ78_05815 [Epsilonproteobacteria bacterium]|nr:MAG: hypothetical protein DRQ78_05815 [Campylobacterota bacterium]